MGWDRSGLVAVCTMCVLVTHDRAIRADPEENSQAATPRASPSRSSRPAPKAFRTEYQAPPDCPTQPDFEWRVQARTQLVVFVSPGDAGLDAGRILVTIQREGSSFLGHLELTGPGTLGTPMSVRDVKDEHCSDVVDALGLITSLAIDPNAAVTAVVPPRVPPPSPLAVSLPVQPDVVPKVAPRAQWGAGAAFAVATGVA